MTRADFMFTIGYQGDTAIVDRNARRKYVDYTTEQLLEEGLFKPAFCSALFGGDEGEMEEFLKRYRAVTGNPAATEEGLKRLYGVFQQPGNIRKVMLI